jgi:hypothetical protein
VGRVESISLTKARKRSKWSTSRNMCTLTSKPAEQNGDPPLQSLVRWPTAKVCAERLAQFEAFTCILLTARTLSHNRI